MESKNWGVEMPRGELKRRSEIQTVQCGVKKGVEQIQSGECAGGRDAKV